MSLPPFAPAILADHGSWATRTVRSHPLQVVTGPVKNGKSTLYAALAEQTPLSMLDASTEQVGWGYIDLLTVGAGSHSGFWNLVASRTGQPKRAVSALISEDLMPDDKRVGEFLDALAEQVPDGKRFILVLDHWDAARAGALVNLAGVEMLANEIASRVNDFGKHAVGCVILTRFPTTKMILNWARALRDSSPGLQRVSGVIERQYRAGPMGFLSRDGSVKTVAALGVPAELQDALYVYTGGWLDLLVAAAGEVNAAPDKMWGQREREVVARRAFDLILDPALRWWIPETHVRSLDYQRPDLDQQQKRLNEIVRDGRSDPAKYANAALPVAVDNDVTGQNMPAPAIYANVTQHKFLVLDTENLVMRYVAFVERVWGSTLSANEVYRLKQGTVGALRRIGFTHRVNRIADELSIPRANVVIVGQDHQRLSDIFGKAMDPSWQIEVTALEGKEMKAKGQDAHDDAVGARWLGEKALQYPNSTFYVLSGDNDYIGNQGAGVWVRGCEYVLLFPWSRNPETDAPNVVSAASRLRWTLNSSFLNSIPKSERIPLSFGSLWSMLEQSDPEYANSYPRPVQQGNVRRDNDGGSHANGHPARRNTGQRNGGHR